MNIRKSLAIGTLAGTMLLSPVWAFADTENVRVTLIQDHKKQEIVTTSETVEDLLELRNIELEPGDRVLPDLHAPLSEDLEVTVLRGRELKILYHGELLQVSLPGETVDEILRFSGLAVNHGVHVLPERTHPLQEGEIIVIENSEDAPKPGEDVRRVEHPLKPVEKEDANLPRGEVKVEKPGTPKVVEETFRKVKGKDGKETDIVVSQKVLAQGEAEVIVKGTGEVKKEENTPAPAPAPKEEVKTPVVSAPEEKMIQGKKYTKKIVMKGTAYDPTAGTKTAMGTRARVGVVAVDPRVIPLGTKLYVESADGFPTYGFAVAEDTGGAIKGNRIDLFYNTNREANRFGRRNVVVYVLAD